MAENKVAVEITLEEKAALKALTQLTRDIQKTEDSFKKMGDQGDNALGVVERRADGVGISFRGLVGGVTIANLASTAIIGAANAMKEFVLDSINAAAEQEEATNRLAQALRATGSFSEEAIDSLSRFATGMALASKYSDDLILSQVAVAKSFGATNKEAEELILAAANLSATFGGSLEENVRKLGATLNGDIGKLGKLVPELKGLSKEALTAGDALDIVNQKFNGAAAAEVETYAGKFAQLKKSFSEFQEAVGMLAVDSGLSSWFQTYATVINDVTQAMSDSQIEAKRQQGGFVETSSSIEQLTRKLNELKVEYIDAEQVVLHPGFFDHLLGRTSGAAENMKRLQVEIKNTQALLDAANAKRTPQSAPEAEAPREVQKSDEEVAREKAKNDKIVAARLDAYTQLEIARAEFNARQVEASVAETEITEQNYAFELERLQAAEQMKIEAVFAAEEQKAQLLTDARTKQFTLEKVAADKEAALYKSNVESKKKLDQQMVALEQQKQAAIAGAALAGMNLLGAIAKDGSREQFLIQKATAIASAVVAAKVAYMQALAFPPGPPATIPTASWVAAAGAANVAAIVATAIKGYNYGGIVPGASTTGDRVPALVNSGEMILNRQQQTNLFNMANGAGGTTSGTVAEALDRLTNAILTQPVHISIDGRKVAESVRTQVQQGFRLA
jgi:hypothetical protein